MKSLRLFKQLSEMVRQAKLVIRVDHENLETVFLEPTLDEKMLVHDGGYVHAYLSTEEDRTYRDWSELGVEYLRQHCTRLNLSLENLLGDEADPRFYICGRAETDFDLAELVNRIAICQDEIFESAYRDRDNPESRG